jgi:hypothetical protein
MLSDFFTLKEERMAKPTENEMAEFDEFMKRFLNREAPKENFLKSQSVAGASNWMTEIALRSPLGIHQVLGATFGTGFEIGWEVAEAWAQYLKFREEKNAVV